MTNTTTTDLGIGPDGLITEDAFREIWGAHVRSNGDMFEHKDVVNLPLETVWTIVEAEDHWVASPGFHIVNKLGYCVTTKPWTDDQLDAYWFLNDLDDGDDENEEGDEGDDTND